VLPKTGDCGGETVKAISIRQPYASMIARGEKRVEVRSWSTTYRGQLLICASRQPAEPTDEPCGVAVCMVELADCREFKRSDVKAAGCSWSPGLFAFALRDPRPVEPFPVRGQLGIFDVELPDAPPAATQSGQLRLF
jgi:ASCH domain-containing protein